MSETKTKPINEWLNELPNLSLSTSTKTVGVDGGQPGKLNSPPFYRVQWNTPNTLLSELTDLYTLASPNGRHILIELYGYTSALLLFYSSVVENGTCSVRGTNFYTGKRFDAQNIDPTTLTITKLLSDYVVEDSSTSSMPYTSFQCYSSSYTVADLISQLSSEGVTTISGQPVIVNFVGMVSGTFLCRLNNIHDTYYGCEFTDLKKLETFYFEGYSASLSLYNSLNSSENKQLSLKDLTENGGGSATDADHIISVTYDELKALRDDASLVPGMFYRITDYECSTTQEGTRAMNHRFDIIVQALSNCSLSEDAKADFNEADDYFRDNESNLGGWELKYCLDNDHNRFAWTSQVIYTDPQHAIPLVRLPRFDWCCEYANGDEYYYAWGSPESDENTDPETLYYSAMPTVTDGELIWYDGNVVDSYVDPVGIGKGVIYHMKDEYGNECPYDFKNIQFQRSAAWQNEDGNAQFIENELCFPVGVVEWFYTFSWVAEDLEVLDTTVNQWIPGDDAYPYGTTNNKIGDNYDSTYPGKSLNNNIFVACENYDTIFYGYNNNVFGPPCYDNTFVNCCSDNIVGAWCYGNRMSNFASNNIDNYFVGNRFIYFWGNKIAKDFGYNDGSQFECNTVEVSCNSNSFHDVVAWSYIGHGFLNNVVEYMSHCKVDNYIEGKRIANCFSGYDDNWNIIPTRVTNNNYVEATVENKE